MAHWTRKWLAAACLFAAGCDDGGSSETEPEAVANETTCVGKCDSLSAAPNDTEYLVDLDIANDIWRSGGAPVSKLAELYTATIILPTGHKILAASHLFGGEIQPIPYHDEDGDSVVDASGQVVFQGDRELARFFTPGQVGYAVKHHRPEHRVLDFAQAAAGGSSGLKEDLKLQDTHIELVVGVRRPLGGASGELVDGVITLNNPQNYQNGRFGNATYSMIFLKPNFPDYMPRGAAQAFNDNIRSMMLGFNAVSKFPGDYNGGDPLAAHSPELVREHVTMMIKALAGEPAEQSEARAWFTKQEHMIYCAELAHVATTAGLLVPLNRAGLVDSGMVSSETYQRFTALIDAHNSGESTPFTTLNANKHARWVTGAVAPADLKPLPSYGTAEEESKLAFRPQTMAEIVEGFLQTHIPRSNAALGGEKLAQVQAGVLKAMQPGLYEAMGMDDSLAQSMVTNAQRDIDRLNEDLADPELPAEQQEGLNAELAGAQQRLTEAQGHLAGLAQKRAVVDSVFNEVLGIVATEYADYDTFRAALAPAMAKARQLTGPRDATGTGYFVPPSALHLVALKNCGDDTRCGGLIGLDYVGHGIHMSAVTIKQTPPPAPALAVIRIQSVVPNPGTDLNGDGVADGLEDETVVLTNTGNTAADLQGYSLTDNVKTRFTFEGSATLAPGETLTIHGAGGAFSGNGSLGLNNTGDTLTLFDASGEQLDALTWAAAAKDQRIEHPAAD